MEFELTEEEHSKLISLERQLTVERLKSILDTYTDNWIPLISESANSSSKYIAWNRDSKLLKVVYNDKVEIHKESNLEHVVEAYNYYQL